MVLDPIAEISRGLEVVRATQAQTQAELDKATADYQRAVDDPPWATVHGTTVADLKAKVDALTWRLDRDKAVVEQLTSMLPPIQDGPAPVVESSPAPPLAPANVHPKSFSPDPKPGDPPVTHGEVFTGTPSGEDFRFAQDKVLRQLRDGMGQKATAHDGGSAIRVIAGDEPDDSPDIYDTFDASFKMEIALRDVFKTGELSSDVADGLKGLLTPDAVASFVTFTGIAIAAALAGGPIGWFIGATGLVILYVTLGESFFDFWSILFNDVSKARNKRQYDLAVKKLARTMSQLGLNWLTTFFTAVAGHFIGKAIGTGAEAGEGASDSAPTGTAGGEKPPPLPPTDAQPIPPTDAQPIPPTDALPIPPTDAQPIPPTDALPDRVQRAGAPTDVVPQDGPARAGSGTEVSRPSNPVADGPVAGGAAGAGGDIAADVRINEARMRATARQIWEAGDYDAVGARVQKTRSGRIIVEPREEVAERYGLQHSLTDTRLDPSQAAIKLQALRRDLGQVIAGQSETIARTPENLQVLAEQYQAARAVIEEGIRRFPDFWDRIPPEARDLVRNELDAAQGRDTAYFKSLYDTTVPGQVQAGGGDPRLAKLVQDAQAGRSTPASDGRPTNPSTHDLPPPPREVNLGKTDTLPRPSKAPPKEVNLGKTDTLPGPSKAPPKEVNLGKTDTLPAVDGPAVSPSSPTIALPVAGAADAAAAGAALGGGLSAGAINGIRAGVIGLTLGISFVGGLLLTGVGHTPSEVASVGGPTERAGGPGGSVAPASLGQPPASHGTVTETFVPASAAPTPAPVPTTRVVVIISGMDISDSPLEDTCTDQFGNKYQYYRHVYTWEFLLANFGVGGTASPDSVRRLVGRTVHVTLAGSTDAGAWTTKVEVTNIGLRAEFAGNPCPSDAFAKVASFTVDGLDLVPAGDGFQGDLP